MTDNARKKIHLAAKATGIVVGVASEIVVTAALKTVIPFDTLSKAEKLICWIGINGAATAAGMGVDNYIVDTADNCIGIVHAIGQVKKTKAEVKTV